MESVKRDLKMKQIYLSSIGALDHKPMAIMIIFPPMLLKQNETAVVRSGILFRRLFYS